MGLRKFSVASLSFRFIIVLLFMFLHLPTMFVFLASISGTSYLTFPPRDLTLKWYAKVLQQTEYVNTFQYSLLLAGVTVCIATAIGTLAAFAIVRYRFPARDFISSFFLSPLIFPMVIIGIALLQFYSMLKVAGTFMGLVFGHVVISFPYVIRTVLASLYRFDEALEEAAMTLGANRVKSFFKITLPIIKPGVVAGAVFAFITSFDNVTVSIFLVGVKNPTLPLVIFSYLEYGLDPSIAAISTFLICLTGLAIFIIEKCVGFSKWGV